MDSQVVWFAWEDHRRSRELSRAFGAKYILLSLDRNRFVRYPVLAILTFFRLIVLRPKKVFCQNPSMVLALFLVAMRSMFGYILIVDRHSNFKFEHEHSNKIKWRLFWFLSRFTVRNADLTIVTNDPLREICERWGGRACVLPDRLPDMSIENGVVSSNIIINDTSSVNVMCVTAFGGDEPIDEIIESANLLGDCFQLYLTGRCGKYLKDKGSGFQPPENVLFTDFISELEYKNLLKSVDVVVVLTTKDLILNCGAYEAVSAGKPLVLSNTDTLRSYFSPGAIFVNIAPESIAEGIRIAWSERETIVAELRELKFSIDASWRKRFTDVLRLSQEIEEKV